MRPSSQRSTSRWRRRSSCTSSRRSGELTHVRDRPAARRDRVSLRAARSITSSNSACSPDRGSRQPSTGSRVGHALGLETLEQIRELSTRQLRMLFEQVSDKDLAVIDPRHPNHGRRRVRRASPRLHPQASPGARNEPPQPARNRQAERHALACRGPFRRGHPRLGKPEAGAPAGRLVPDRLGHRAVSRARGRPTSPNR